MSADGTRVIGGGGGGGAAGRLAVLKKLCGCSTSPRAWKPANDPVPLVKWHLPVKVANAPLQRPVAVLPNPASRTTLLSSLSGPNVGPT